MSNSDIRTAAKRAGVYLYEVAAVMGISEPTMTRKLRFELSDEQKKAIFNTIEKIRNEKQKNASC